MTEQEYNDIAIQVSQKLFEVEVFYWRVYPQATSKSFTVSCKDYSLKTIIELWHVAKLASDMITTLTGKKTDYRVMEHHILITLESKR